MVWYNTQTTTKDHLTNLLAAWQPILPVFTLTVVPEKQLHTYPPTPTPPPSITVTPVMYTQWLQTGEYLTCPTGSELLCDAISGITPNGKSRWQMSHLNPDNYVAIVHLSD